jgi:hypothetical protein
MISLASTDVLLNKAFNLACFILGDRNAALRVVAGALAKLEVAVAAQGKRLYYRPTGRPSSSRRTQSNPFRNNISFNELHLFQRLIYIESEPYEVAQEEGKGSKPPGEEDLVIHFVKHLTRKTIKRNSFYVTLGLSRLLYSYTTRETMDIYNAVIQDPERVKDDYYYRSRKGVLMQELKERFGDLINTCHGPHGEERFQADDNQSRFVKLVWDCLSLFTPWHTPCLVPAGVDPIRDGIPSLSYQGHKEEDQIEVNRMHAVVHPDCFRRLIADLHFDAPDTRLEIPRFFYANHMNDNGSGRNGRQPPKLDEEELMSIKGELDKYAARRKAAHASLLRIIVDGTEHARIDLKETGSARFSLDKDAELIEVRSRDNAGEELLLASHLFASIEPENAVQEADASIILEGGQKISIHTSPASDETSTIVEVIYRETKPLRAASVFFQQMAQSIGSASPRGIWNDRRIFGTAVAFILLAICFGVILKYAWKGSRDGIDRNTAATQQNGAVNERESLATQKAPKDNGTTATAEKKIPSPSNRAPQQVTEAAQQRQVSRRSGESENTARISAQEKPGDANVPETVAERQDNTRSVAALRVAVPLSAVKKVYLETSGDERFAQNLREMLGGRLRANNRISLAHDRDEADALLKVTVLKGVGTELERANVLVELISARGDVIWPNAKSGGKYQGNPAAVSASIIRDLLVAIQKSGHRR